jgi:uncharacterized protein YebE (UPF0316 family)
METIFAYVILPLLIFLARITDVSLGTIRIIFISKGYKLLSLIIGFFEVLIWLVAINRIWSDLANVWLYIAYAGGFAIGNYVGIWLDEKISLGHAMVRIIIRKNPKKLINELKRNNYHITIINGQSGEEESGVKIILSVIKRKELKNIFKIIKNTNPHAFYTVEDVRNTRKNEYFVIKQKRANGKKFK